MHVAEQGRIPAATATEAKSVCKYTCPNSGCGKVFFNTHGCKVHAGRCRRSNYYEVSRILAVKGDTGSPARRFLIKWKGYDSSHNSWEPRCNIDPGLVTNFLKANDIYEYDWHGARCPHCDKPLKSARGVKIHLRFCKYRPAPQQQFTGTCAARKVRDMKMQVKQKEKAKVLCEDSALQNTFTFKYLGLYSRRMALKYMT